MELKDLQPKLDELKSALEESLTKAQKAEIEKQIKAVSDEIAEIKKAAGKPDEATSKLIVDLQGQLKEIKEAADKNQPVIDAFVKDGDKKHIKDAPLSFEGAIEKAITENNDAIEKFARKETKSLILDLPKFDVKAVGDMTTGNVTSGTRYGQQFAPSIIQQPYRKVHVRDLLPVSAAGPGNTFTFMKEATTGEGEIAPTAETSTKPQFDIDLVEATVNFETIAGWLRVTRKAMRNIPGFIAWLQQRLPEKLLRVEDAQLLYGDGNTPNLKGIGTSGNFTAAVTSATQIEEALIDAISLLEDTNERYATGIVVRPSTYYNFFKNKATDSGVYDLPKNFVFINNVLYISGIPVIPSTAVTYGDYFVGDFREGAQILVQEGMRLEFFEQDGTNVRENKVTVRIEETIAFPVYGSSFFVKGNDATNS